MRILAILFLTVSTGSVLAQRSDFAQVSFDRADSIAISLNGHGLHDVRGLTQKLTSNLSTDVEKVRTIYRWICDNIENDYALAEEAARNRSKFRSRESLMAYNRKFMERVVARLRKSNKTVCTGYAYLLKQMCMQAGITCEVVNGYGRTIRSNVGGEGELNHSWNAVQLNGKWYLLDATWSSGAIVLPEKAFAKSFVEGYFLAEPALFIRNHYPLENSWMLLDEKPSLEEFLNRPITYTGVYDYHVTRIFPERFNLAAKTGDVITFQLGLVPPNDPVKATVSIQRGGGSPMTQVVTPFMKDGLYCIEHPVLSKGSYVVTIVLGGKNIASWSVVVR